MPGFVADAINSKTLVIETEMVDIIAKLAKGDEFKCAWRVEHAGAGPSNQGVGRAQGSPRAIFPRPASARAANFSNGLQPTPAASS